jgi:hypothetical protein
MIATVATLQARVGQDVAGWLTRNSLAFDWPRYSKGKYAGVQKESAPGVVPWAYRACIRKMRMIASETGDFRMINSDISNNRRRRRQAPSPLTA